MPLTVQPPVKHKPRERLGRVEDLNPAGLLCLREGTILAEPTEQTLAMLVGGDDDAASAVLCRPTDDVSESIE